ncbi:hypothetical protein URH17368_0818 [Alicyclobacillus hesperidum URH17-3-68]|nr:hypothetical protein URH17368_0818 [Alicyclobacillus hesperidum URH17-3-68]
MPQGTRIASDDFPLEYPYPLDYGYFKYTMELTGAYLPNELY